MTSLWLKVIAVITMTIDHVGMVLFPHLLIYRIIGRVAFPIFAFLAAQSCRHTRNIRRYMTRLGLFALVSELPFNLATGGQPMHPYGQNIFFTLLLGVMACWLYDKLQGSPLALLPPLALCLFGQLMGADYGWYGVAMIFAFYLAGNSKLRVGLALVTLTVVSQWHAIMMVLGQPRLVVYALQLWCVFAVIPLAFYNGQRGRGPKYFFYLYYPIHLGVLYLLSLVFPPVAEYSTILI